MEAKSCPICRAPSLFAMRHPQADIYRCPECDHCFSAPDTMLTQESYEPAYYRERHKNWFENPNLSLFKAIWRMIQAHKQNAAVLDAGCGQGGFLRYLRAQDKSLALTGLDLSFNPPVPGIEFIQSDLMQFNPGRRFDAVVSIAVIEHTEDPRQFLERLRCLVAPGGLLVVTTLDERGVLYAAARFCRQIGFQGPFVQLYERHHLHHFNRSSLNRLLQTQQLQPALRIGSNIPLRAVDCAGASKARAAVLRGGVSLAFAFGTLIGRPFLQTVIVRC